MFNMVRRAGKKTVIPVACALLLALGSVAGSSQLVPADQSGTLTYFIAIGKKESGYRASDRELAEWALKAWERSAAGAIRLEPARESLALIRVYWASADGGLYGEMRPLRVGDRKGAAVFISPDAAVLGDDARRASEDPLLRESIVYLTCLHELGHAFGLSHTDDFADIMYSFQFGGDIPQYFGRYRTQLMSRDQMTGVSGLSEGDVKRLRELYPRK